jgi:hypothetical protein
LNYGKNNFSFTLKKNKFVVKHELLIVSLAMLIKRNILSIVTLMAIMSFGVTSCTKKCNIADASVDSGVIVSEDPATNIPVIIYPESGYLTSNMGGDYLVNASDPYADRYEVSFDGGYTRVPVDYGVYNILALPMTINCNARFERNVTIDATNSVITYSVTANTCSSCEDKYTVENYVLVPVLPAYPIVYQPTIIEN